MPHNNTVSASQNPLLPRAIGAVIAWSFVTITAIQTRWQQVTATRDAGSETTEKAVITAIGLGLAVGLGAAITAAVHHYQSQIH